MGGGKKSSNIGQLLTSSNANTTNYPSNNNKNLTSIIPEMFNEIINSKNGNSKTVLGGIILLLLIIFVLILICYIIKKRKKSSSNISSNNIPVDSVIIGNKAISNKNPEPDFHSVPNTSQNLDNIISLPDNNCLNEIKIKSQNNLIDDFRDVMGNAGNTSGGSTSGRRRRERKKKNNNNGGEGGSTSDTSREEEKKEGGINLESEIQAQIKQFVIEEHKN